MPVDGLLLGLYDGCSEEHRFKGIYACTAQEGSFDDTMACRRLSWRCRGSCDATMTCRGCRGAVEALVMLR
jgi:hypothetical protein